MVLLIINFDIRIALEKNMEGTQHMATEKFNLWY